MCKTWIAMGPTTLVGCFAPAPGGSCAHQTAPNCYKYTMGDKTLYVSSNATFPQITKAETPWEDCGFMSSEEAEAFGLPDCP